MATLESIASLMPGRVFSQVPVFRRCQHPLWTRKARVYREWRAILVPDPHTVQPRAVILPCGSSFPSVWGSLFSSQLPYETRTCVCGLILCGLGCCSYGLMAYTVGNRMGAAFPVAKWMLQQRNSLGGFSSTQDTVVALEALSAYAAGAMSGSSQTLNPNNPAGALVPFGGNPSSRSQRACTG